MLELAVHITGSIIIIKIKQACFIFVMTPNSLARRYQLFGETNRLDLQDGSEDKKLVPNYNIVRRHNAGDHKADAH